MGKTKKKTILIQCDKCQVCMCAMGASQGETIPKLNFEKLAWP